MEKIQNWKCPKCGREFKNVNQSHYCGEKPKTIEEYIVYQDTEKQADLFLMRQILREALPEAEERISYGKIDVDLIQKIARWCMKTGNHASS